jgi:hypothetical protein
MTHTLAFLLRFEEPTASPPAIASDPSTQSAEGMMPRQDLGVSVLGTKTVTEVRAEAPENDPQTQSYCTIPS